MSKYKLINTKTKEEHLCEKVTINGFEYYIVDEEPSLYDTLMGCYYIFKKTLYKRELNHHTGCKKVIATNNPNIDIPKVVDEVEKFIKKIFYKEDGINFKRSTIGADDLINGFKIGYNKSQETYSFSEEDMIEFAEFVAKYSDKNKNYKGEMLYAQSKYDGAERTIDLLQLWKEQQPKIIYYNK